jgi:hypothetical protein
MKYLKFFFLITVALKLSESFSPISTLSTIKRPAFACTTTLSLSSDEDPETSSFQEKLNRFLDKPLFDPDKLLEKQTDKVKESPESSINPLVWFANLVKNDYETAEALYAAGIISFLVVLTQELLRMVQYGDAYQPFSSVTNGSLF